ncbi:SMI1/KNR4 family protein, partial [Paenibacillus plantiphilus]|uniref:SMI1/KNR4 family protein n=1 Tax=Paenibacillus plantiphilus TaxID=2905650 RepID=UPI001F1BDF04
MTKVISRYKKLSITDIELFEKQNEFIFPDEYRKFLLENNGGKPEPHIFKISDEKGESGVTGFFTINDGARYNQLERYLDIFKGRIPKGFIPIGDDPGGNMICLGMDGK